MSKKLTIGDEVLVFADSRGYYSLERSNEPTLRRVRIASGCAADGDYRVESADEVSDHKILYAKADRLYPLGTTLVDGTPVAPDDSPASRPMSDEYLDRYIDLSPATDSDGGVDLSMGLAGLDTMPLPLPERHYSCRPCGCERVCGGSGNVRVTAPYSENVITIKDFDIDPDVARVLFGPPSGTIDANGNILTINEEPTVGPNEDSFYANGTEPLVERPESEITFTVEQVTALLKAFSQEV